jgi:hypothetical protein
MTGLLEEMRHLRSAAGANRDAGDTTAAVQALEQGVVALEGALAGHIDPGDDETALAMLLADFYGMLGGSLREQGSLAASAAAYDSGFRLESNPRYAMRTTYNSLNRLVTRILLVPGCLSDPGLLRQQPELEFVNVPDELARLHQQIAGAGSTDFWAIGDLFLTCALTGDEPGLRHALDAFTRLSPPPAAYDAYAKSIEALAVLDTPRKAILHTASTLWPPR